MTIQERKQLLTEQLRTERERKQQLADLLAQSERNEQQLIGAITVLDQITREEATPGESASKKPDKDPLPAVPAPSDKAGHRPGRGAD